MPQRLANILADYRNEDGYSIDRHHVDLWLQQFPSTSRMGICDELAHVFTTTYFSKQRVLDLLNSLVENPNVTNGDAEKFWSSTSLLKIQQRSESQQRMNKLLLEVVKNRIGVTVGTRPNIKSFIYLDDIICSGDQLSKDLLQWVDRAPEKSSITVVSVVTHASAYYGRNLVTEKAATRGISYLQLFALSIENRLSKQTNSEILWPTNLTASKAVDSYLTQPAAGTRKIELRSLPSESSTSFFTSERARELIEQAFFEAGSAICGFPAERKAYIHPLGYSRFPGLGFGTLAATFLNCPNNAPLALWWGSPNDPYGTLSKWYPLMERRVRHD